jgi:hypothetical protein
MIMDCLITDCLYENRPKQCNGSIAIKHGTVDQFVYSFPGTLYPAETKCIRYFENCFGLMMAASF